MQTLGGTSRSVLRMQNHPVSVTHVMKGSYNVGAYRSGGLAVV